MDVDRARLRLLLGGALAAFTARDGGAVGVVHGVVHRGVTAQEHAALQQLVVGSGKAGLCAAIALALADDASGIAVLRDPHAHYCTNSCIELALAQCARLLLGDVRAPLRFINASLVGDDLASLVGAAGRPGGEEG